MKKSMLFFVCLVLSSYNAYSCDVCGCGAFNSTQGLGTLAQGNRTSIGLNYQYRLYKSQHPKVFGTGIERSTDYFQRIDLTGQIRLANRWQLQLTVPFGFNTHIADDTTSRKNGFGDPILTVNYFLFNRQDSLQTRLFRWIIGAGVKSPVGKFTQPNDVDLYLYPGTGTFDAVFQNSFFFQKKKWSLLQTSQYILRGENKIQVHSGFFVQRKFIRAIQIQNLGNLCRSAVFLERCGLSEQKTDCQFSYPGTNSHRNSRCIFSMEFLDYPGKLSHSCCPEPGRRKLTPENRIQYFT